MKQSQAEKLICPFIEAVDKGGWSVSNGRPKNITCITSECMAWEWDTNEDDPEYMKQNKNKSKPDPNGYCFKLKNKDKK